MLYYIIIRTICMSFTVGTYYAQRMEVPSELAAQLDNLRGGI